MRNTCISMQDSVIFTYRLRTTQETEIPMNSTNYEEDVSFGPDYDYGDNIEFAHPGGNSALRAAGRNNPRNLPCPTCGQSNRLTPADVRLGYQCDVCADQLERGY